MFRKNSEEMNVVGHDDVATNEDFMGGCLGGEEAKGAVDGWMGEERFSVVSTEGQEVEELGGVDSVQAAESGFHPGEQIRATVIDRRYS